MDELDEIKRLLKSDTVTNRKLGRTMCSEKICTRSVLSALATNASLTTQLLQALVENEGLELDRVTAKNKEGDASTARVFRDLVRSCILYGKLNSPKLGFLFEHVLGFCCNVIGSNSSSSSSSGNRQRRNSYKNCLIDSIHPVSTHGLPFVKHLKNIIVYLKAEMVGLEGCKDVLNHKLLKAVCRNMFTDTSTQARTVLANMVQWFAQLLQSTAEDDKVQALVASTTAECCYCFVHTQKLNLFDVPLLHANLEVIVQVVVKHLSSYQFREQTLREAYVRFLDAYLQHYALFQQATYSRAVSKGWSDAVRQLAVVTTSDDYLRHLLQSSTRSSTAAGGARLSSSLKAAEYVPDVSAKDDRTICNYRLVAAALHWEAALLLDMIPSPSGEFDDLLLRYSAAAATQQQQQQANKHKLDATATSSSSSMKRQKLHSEAMRRTGSSIPPASSRISWSCSRLFDRVEHVAQDLKLMSGSCSSSSSYSHSGAKKEGGPACSHVAPVPQRPQLMQILESCLLVLLVSLVHCPDIDLVQLRVNSSGDHHTCDHGSSDAQKLSIQRWVMLLTVLLEASVQVEGGELTAVGYMLQILVHLLRRTELLVFASTGQPSSHHDIALGGIDADSRLLSAWTDLFGHLLLRSGVFRRFTKAVRRDTVGSCLLGLVEGIIRSQLVDCSAAHGMIQYEDTVWLHQPLQNPAALECSMYFSYLSTVLFADDGCSSGFLAMTSSTSMMMMMQLVLTSLNDSRNDAFQLNHAIVDNLQSLLVKLDDPDPCRRYSPRFIFCLQFLFLWFHGGLSAIAPPPSSSKQSSTDIQSWMSGNNNPQQQQQQQVVSGGSGGGNVRLPVSDVRGYMNAMNYLILSMFHVKNVPIEHYPCSSVIDISNNELHWLEPSIQRWTQQQQQHQHIAAPSPGSCCFDKRYPLVSSVRGCDEMIAGLKDLLDFIKQALLSPTLTSHLKSDASNDISHWHTLALVAMSSLTALLGAAHSSATISSTSLDAIHSWILESVFLLVKCSVAHLEHRVPSIKLKSLAQYFHLLAAIVTAVSAHPTPNKRKSSSSSSSSSSSHINHIRQQCLSLVIKVLRSVQALALLNKFNYLQSDGGGGSSSSSSSSGRARPLEASSGVPSAAAEDDAFFDASMDTSSGPAIPSSSSSSSTKRKSKVYDHREDDVADEGDDRNADPHMKILMFANDPLNAYISVLRCAISCCGRSSDDLVQVTDAMFSIDVAGKSVKIQVGSEIRLIIAEYLSSERLQVAPLFLLRFVDSCPWHQDWHALGYCKVLGIVWQVVQRPDFWTSSNDVVSGSGTMFSYVVNIVIGEDDDVLRSYLDTLWQCRWLQLQCVVEFIRHADISSIKNSVSKIFLEAFTDDNSMVRLSAAQSLGLLLPHFKNKRKIYESLIKGTGIDIVHRHVGSTGEVSSAATAASTASSPEDAPPIDDGSADGESALVLSALGTGLTQMVSDYDDINKQTLLDLLLMHCSRQQIIDYSSCSLQQKITSSTTTTPPPPPSSSSSSAQQSYQLKRFIRTVSVSLSYRSECYLLVDYFRWLFHRWLRTQQQQQQQRSESPVVLEEEESRGDRMGDASTAALMDFPFHYLLGVDGLSSSSSSSSTTLTVAIRAVLRQFSWVIVPVIAMEADARYRDAALRKYVALAGSSTGSPSSGDISILVRTNISSLKVLELTLRTVAAIRKSRPLTDRPIDNNTVTENALLSEQATCHANQVMAFAAQYAGEINASTERLNVSNYVRQVFMLHVAATDAVEAFESTGGALDDTVDGRSLLLVGVLERLCQWFGLADIPELFLECNLLDILSTLHLSLLTTRRSSANIAVLSSIHVLVMHPCHPLSYAVLQGMLDIVRTSIRHFPAQIPSLIDPVLTALIRLVTGSMCVAEYAEEEILSFVPELFSDLILLLKLLADKLCKYPDDDDEHQQQQQSSRGGSKARAGDVLQLLTDSGVLDSSCLRVRDRFSECYFSRSFCCPADDDDDEGDAYIASVPLPIARKDITTLHESIAQLVACCIEASSDHQRIMAQCLPLPKHYHSRSLSALMDGVGWSTSCSICQRVEYATRLIQQVIRGQLLTVSLVWIQIQLIIELFMSIPPEGEAPAAAGAAADVSQQQPLLRSERVSLYWKDKADLASSFLSALLSLSQYIRDRYNADDADDEWRHGRTHGQWQWEGTVDASSRLGLSHVVAHRSSSLRSLVDHSILVIAGTLGSPDILSLSHMYFPIRLNNIVRIYNYSIDCIVIQLLRSLYSMLWSSIITHTEVAQTTLRELSAHSYFATIETDHVSKSAVIPSLVRDLIHSYRIHTASAEHEQGALPHSLQRRLLLHPEQHQHHHQQVSVESAELWTTVGKSYEQWITQLSFHLIDKCYESNNTDSSSSSSSLTSASATAAAAMFTQTKDVFIAEMKHVCLVRSDMAEAVLPVIVYGVLKTNGVNSHMHQLFSSMIARHMLSPDCVMMRATQLGCQVLTFLMKQDMDDFIHLQCSSSSSIVKGLPRLEPTKSNDTDWSLPYSYILNIDLRYAAQAAIRCQLVCSALLFAELSCEGLKYSLESATCVGDVSSTGSHHALARGGVVSSYSSDLSKSLHDVLLPIYESIHDADAVYGIDLCSSLDLQALLYSKKGKWSEALSTYEAVVQGCCDDSISSSSSSSSSEHAKQGIKEALESLGAKYILDNFNRGMKDSSNGPSLLAWDPALEANPPPPLLDHHRSSYAADSRMSFTNRERFSRSCSNRSNSLTTIIAQMVVRLREDDSATVDARLQTCSNLLCDDLRSKLSQETASSIISNLVQAEQLLEIRDVMGILSSSSSSSDSSLDDSRLLLDRWQRRLEEKVNIDDAYNDGHFSLRTGLLRQLIEHKKISSIQAVRSLYHCSFYPSTVTSAHAITPTMYKFWKYIISTCAGCHQLSTTVRRGGGGGGSSSSSDEELSNALINSYLSFYECQLLWTKGLKDAAISNVNVKVIAPLKALQSGSSSSYSCVTTGGTIQLLQSDSNHVSNLLSEALRTAGEWVSTKRAATGTGIIDDYLDPAVRCATTLSERIKAHSTLAVFNARLYQNVKAKVRSSEWKQGARVLADRKKELDSCRALQGQLSRGDSSMKGSDAAVLDPSGVDPKALNRHVVTLKKEVDLDSKERSAVESSVNRYLIAAVADLGKVLQMSTEADVDIVLRLVQLWLANCANHQINLLIDEIIATVPSYKFAPLTYQLLSRLGGSDDKQQSNAHIALSEQLRESFSPRFGLQRTFTANSTTHHQNMMSSDSIDTTTTCHGEDDINNKEFQLTLCRMVLRLCRDHPHHILSQLFALAHERELGASYDGALHVKSNLSTSRYETAKLLLNQLNGVDALRQLVTSTQSMLLAYIDLANASTVALQQKRKTKGIVYKEVQPRGKRFNEIMGSLPVMPAVITIEVPLSPINDYSTVVLIAGFQPTFSITDNGISRPKIITCNGSDGNQYVQLVKGGDDMRQDAVMEQVFGNVNYILRRDDETRKRNLGIRTYKIIPTTPQTGILEFVKDTAAFGSLLCDRMTGVHPRYYPNDWSHAQCRDHLKDAVDNSDKHSRFNEICTRYHPAFRFFFLEHYVDPAQWMSARLAYTRSVAVNSIIGYILGIGDRHAHNILVDTVTAEVVHIDFGIVFEQGKGLGTPETVPFRLTRDIIDAMGVTGCEGTFRRCCEEVMRVLRSHSQHLMTILEVVVHDPLYKWSLSPLQARIKQNIVTDFNHNELRLNHPPHTAAASLAAAQQTVKPNFGKDAAERTLSRVRQKLQGQEDVSSSAGEALSVEGQVDLLINEARSKDNLSRLFFGWAPWL